MLVVTLRTGDGVAITIPPSEHQLGMTLRVEPQGGGRARVEFDAPRAIDIRRVPRPSDSQPPPPPELLRA